MNFEEFNNFKPKDFLKFSQKLEEMIDDFPNDSSVTRTIISRIYYATFLYVREWSKTQLGYLSNPHKDHRQLPNFIEKKGPFSKYWNREIAGFLRLLKTMRQQSDYDLKIPEKGTCKYKKWQPLDRNYAFQIANEIFDSFENLK